MSNEQQVCQNFKFISINSNLYKKINTNGFDDNTKIEDIQFAWDYNKNKFVLIVKSVGLTHYFEPYK